MCSGHLLLMMFMELPILQIQVENPVTLRQVLVRLFFPSCSTDFFFCFNISYSQRLRPALDHRHMHIYSLHTCNAIGIYEVHLY